MSTGIPVIDVSRLRSTEISDRKAVAIEIRKASNAVGFFYITNHGIKEHIVDRMFAETKHFFDLPLEVKNQISIAKSPISRGFEPIGYQTLDQTAAPDLKEGFYIGVERGPDDLLVHAKTPIMDQTSGLPICQGGDRTWNSISIEC